MVYIDTMIFRTTIAVTYILITILIGYYGLSTRKSGDEFVYRENKRDAMLKSLLGILGTAMSFVYMRSTP